ncbi:MAG: TIGR04149 family rSAM-modified RiPP [Cytophagales bacterium]|nr:TIGR04149 family rSAM-modified RiPP [Cytophagales bacterium]
MKKLGRLKLNSEKLLSHDELVSFKGGSGWDCEYYSCFCNDGTGAWTGYYCNGGSHALEIYCSGSGGQCTTMGGG